MSTRRRPGPRRTGISRARWLLNPNVDATVDAVVRWSWDWHGGARETAASLAMDGRACGPVRKRPTR